ncbi:MAG: peptidoglycan DD-metalloendopeptidase family protein [Legionellaceae bacterium]|nr:peptidoglycan DD-metalloendopeptidase family protein [Legionellaceae bacterium]
MQQRNTTENKKSIKVYKHWVFIGISIVLMLSIYTMNYKYQQPTVCNSIDLPTSDEEFVDTDSQEDPENWTNIITKPNDTLGKIFEESGIGQKTLHEVLHDNPFAKSLTNIRPNQQIQFLIQNDILERIIFPINTTEFLVSTRKDNKFITTIQSRSIDSHEEYVSATVHGSLYNTAKKANIPYKLIQQMTKIFEWEIDFAKDIREGDKFSILYTTYFVDDTKISTGDIVAVEYKRKANVHQAVAHTNKAGDTEYYTPDGHSLKKAFARYPIKYSHISSTFNPARKHPILNYVRPHKGIDLAARLGTPILATGDGRIKFIGLNSGYGNMIKISHNKNYETVYAHMVRFKKGLSKGDYVKRGQLIGYVGQTGLATAPHCHYEFHINKKAQNPTTIKLPQAESIAIQDKNDFLQKANKIIVSLKLYDTSNLADANTKQSTDTG